MWGEKKKKGARRRWKERGETEGRGRMGEERRKRRGRDDILKSRERK